MASIGRQNKMNYVLGVTGLMGSGKTYVCSKLIELCTKKQISINYLSIDEIRREILGANNKYINSRVSIAEILGLKLEGDSSINRQELNKIIYSSNESMNSFKSIINPIIRENIIEKKKYTRLMLIEWAMIVQDGFLKDVDYNVLLVKCDYDNRIKRLINGDLPKEEIIKRIILQLSEPELESILKSSKLNNYFMINSLNVNYSALLDNILKVSGL